MPNLATSLLLLLASTAPLTSESSNDDHGGKPDKANSQVENVAPRIHHEILQFIKDSPGSSRRLEVTVFINTASRVSTSMSETSTTASLREGKVFIETLDGKTPSKEDFEVHTRRYQEAVRSRAQAIYADVVAPI